MEDIGSIVSLDRGDQRGKQPKQEMMTMYLNHPHI